MQHPKLRTKGARTRRKRGIMRSMIRLSEKINPAMRGGDNFYFIRWGELAELKLWERRP